LHSLTLAQLRATENSVGVAPILQFGDEDLQLKQVPHPLFSNFLPQIIVKLPTSVMLHLGSTLCGDK